MARGHRCSDNQGSTVVQQDWFSKQYASTCTGIVNTSIVPVYYCCTGMRSGAEHDGGDTDRGYSQLLAERGSPLACTCQTSDTGQNHAMQIYYSTST